MNDIHRTTNSLDVALIMLCAVLLGTLIVGSCRARIDWSRNNLLPVTQIKQAAHDVAEWEAAR